MSPGNDRPASPNISLQRTAPYGLAAELWAFGHRITLAALTVALSLGLSSCSSTPVGIAKSEITWPPGETARDLGFPEHPKSGGEIRVWLGGGVVRPYDVFRICETSEGTTGEHIAFTEVVQADATRTTDQAYQENEDMRIFLRDVTCHSEVSTTPEWMFCRVKSESTVEWQIITQDLMPTQLWKLPEKVKRNCGVVTMDGEVVTIEILTNRRYHIVQYDNPDFCCVELPCAIVNHVRTVVRRIQ